MKSLEINDKNEQKRFEKRDSTLAKLLIQT